MFLKFCVTNAIEEFIRINELNSETLVYFERGAIDSFMPVIKQRRLDAKQGAVLVISGTIANAAQSGALIKLKKQSPRLYHDLEALWNSCTSLLLDDRRRWGNVVLGGNFPENPFEYADKCA